MLLYKVYVRTCYLYVHILYCIEKIELDIINVNPLIKKKKKNVR